MRKTASIAIAAIILIVLAGVSFYAGISYGKNKNQGARFGPPNGNVLTRGNRQQGGGFLSGEITSKDNNSITLKLMNGGSKIIFFSDKTEVGKFTAGALDDLQTGKSVSVQGQTNQDGSVTAQSIQLRPEIKK